MNESTETDYIPDDYDNSIPTELKLEINNLIWMYAPENLTLGVAERLSIRICTLIKNGGIQ